MTKDEKAAEDWLLRFPVETCSDYCFEDTEAHIRKAFLAALKHRDDNPPWVSVEERLPERDELLGEQTFFTYDERSGTFDMAFYESGWEFDAKAFVIGVTHWQEAKLPLPKGPKKEGE